MAKTMKVYVGIDVDNKKIIGVWKDRTEAEKYSALYGLANRAWVNVVESVLN